LVTRSVVDLARIAAERAQPGHALSAIVELRRRLDELEEYQVENARSQGWSWSEIAQPLGVTRQAIHRKYANRLDASAEERRRGRMVVGAAARRAVVRARREAGVLRHSSVGTDHLLLGVLSEDAAGAPLRDLGLQVDRVRAAVVELRGPEAPADEMRGAVIPISPRAREALEQSLREALRLGNETIGAQHILLALLRDDESHAAEILDRLGVAAAAIEQRLGL
jgi:hypothetical protein